jgi:hypothetical protein
MGGTVLKGQGGRPMRFQAKTVKIIETARAVLTDAEGPMTVRQVYYQLVSRQVIENNQKRYKSVSKALVKARQQGIIPWEWIEDRLRKPRHVNMWRGLPSFAKTAKAAYRRDVWESQPDYLEVWLEKDALSGIFEDALGPYGVTLNVGRGFDGWDSIRNVANRCKDRENAMILYFGDFDPSGEDMARSLRDRIAFFKVYPEIVKCALTKEDIERYSLPPDFAKKTDSRAAKFIAKNGDVSVELDALPNDILKNRLIEEIKARMDLDALEETKAKEEKERKRLVEALSSF